MPQLSTVDFATTPEGVAFYGAYDLVLEKWPVDVTSVDLETQHGTTRVNICGPADARALVLLPGGGATSTVWFQNVAALADRYRVFAVDLIGDAGRSVAGDNHPRTVDDLLSWLDDVTTAAGLAAFSLVGHSYGAMIALAYALREPDRVQNLVLLDPNSCFVGMRAQYLARAIPLLLRPTEKRRGDFIRWETNGQHIDEDWLDLDARGAEHFPKSRTVVPKRPKRNALEALTVDTTVILAEGSKVHDSRRLATVTESIPRLRTIIVGGATHHTMPMSPATELNCALLDGLAPRESERPVGEADSP
ncbi:alpha/beta fold hydrolase [Rhodococcus maanshanensis]|uniref:Pimeloyl-ACP methyl ester carboxylesterase n=1 Tax=Rhodococcus maanshanensis TaxID=183556 RepID=A0A1H7V3S2_9NOCA|nr:alpha/beta fold hydrolase [Rhodococcus maanshanensis]SEM03764.1 Pimeloyl-ACP methyl ester carboxylesterase [Rhodococcus maanshanensis]